jgi:hypothetical protein
VSDFLKTKGIELKEGSYANFIQNGCKVLTEAINLSQQGVSRARNELDKRLDAMREVIHQKTAPRQPPNPPAAAPSSTAGPTVETKPPDAPPAQSPPPGSPEARKTKPASPSKKQTPRRRSVPPRP